MLEFKSNFSDLIYKEHLVGKVFWLLNLLMFPVLRTINDWRINCGADSKNASKTPEAKAFFLMLRTRCKFSGKLVSISKSATNSLIFLKEAQCVRKISIIYDT